MGTVDMAGSCANAAKECGAHSYDMDSSPLLIGNCAPLLERKEWRQKKITALRSKTLSMLSTHADTPQFHWLVQAWAWLGQQPLAARCSPLAGPASDSTRHPGQQTAVGRTRTTSPGPSRSSAPAAAGLWGPRARAGRDASAGVGRSRAFSWDTSRT